MFSALPGWLLQSIGSTAADCPAGPNQENRPASLTIEKNSMALSETSFKIYYSLNLFSRMTGNAIFSLWEGHLVSMQPVSAAYRQNQTCTLSSTAENSVKTSA
jgi:hypothetical protein